MIEEFVSLRNVGLFADYRGAEEGRFGPLTLIYGNNGTGKSTLVAVLRSLATGDPIPVLERLTLGEAEQPTIEVATDGGLARFDGERWSGGCGPVFIFDQAFIHENVHIGEQVEHEHKMNLHRFAIGGEGVALAKRIIDLDDEIRRLNARLSEDRGQVQRAIVGERDVDDFVGLPRAEDLEARLEAKEREFRALQAASDLLSKPSLVPLKAPDLPVEEVAGFLSTPAEAAAGAGAAVRARIAERLDERGEEWLARGTAYLDSEECPFCGREVGESDLIEAYRTYFSQAYSELKKRIGDMARRIEAAISPDSVLALKDTVVSNRQLAEFWSAHLGLKAPHVAFEQLLEPWQQSRRILLCLLTAKGAGPLEDAGGSGELAQARALRDVAQACVDQYNAALARFNGEIAKTKETLADGDPTALAGAISQLRNQQARWAPEVAALCESYLAEREDKTCLEREKKQARERLRAYTSSVLGAYEEGINGRLASLGAGFRAVGVTESHVGGKPRLDYRLTIDSRTFELQPGRDGAPRPSFRSALSAGDKACLALAFFLTRLEGADLSGASIVLDDPLSSLDPHRRRGAQEAISRLTERAEQVIVLSHDPDFLKLFLGGSVEARALCLSRGAGGSRLAPRARPPA